MTRTTRGAAGRVPFAFATPTALFLAIAAASTGTHHAQAAEPGAAVVEEVVVTGSRIRGIDALGSNRIAIDQEDMVESPVLSTADLLHRVPQVITLGANADGGSAQNGAANVTRGDGINLRGVGTQSTLVLYEGRRFAPAGTQGQYTDPSVLPSIALERIEVIADGASAIYGSDAVVGVVNIMLRKDFEGAEVRARHGISDGGYHESQVAAIGGHEWTSGRLMVAAEYTENDVLEASERNFYGSDQTDRGGRDLRSTQCNPGNLVVDGTYYAIPEGGVTAGNVDQLSPGTRNRCDNIGLNSILPERDRRSFVFSASQDASERISLFADGYYSKREFVLWGNGRSPGETFAVTVPDSNPFFVSPDPNATSVVVDYSLIPEAGVSENPGFADSFNVTGGLRADLWSDWRAEAYYAHGESEDVVNRRYGTNSGALAAAAADPDPATAFNPFGGANHPATIAAIRDRLFVIQADSELDVFNLQLDGSLFELPAGMLRLAVGGEYREEYLSTDLEIGSSAGSIHVVEDADQTVKAVFAELFVPLVADAPWAQSLDLSAALRHEDYSNFGTTTNPKIGLTWAPVTQVTVRGSYGTSFRAPAFAEIFTRGAGAGLYGDTMPDPSAPGGTRYGIGRAGGNPELTPEEATTWSLGAEYLPESVPGLKLSATYFSIDYDNQIIGLRGTAGLLTSPLYADFVIDDPTDAQIQALLSSGAPINTPINPDLVTFIVDGRRQNVGVTKTEGYDFEISYLRDAFDVSLAGTYLTRLDTALVQGAPLVDVLDTINNSQAFRAQGSVGWRRGDVNTRVILNHTSGYDNDTVTPAQDVDAWTTLDAYVAYQWTDTLTLALDARNLFDEDPPFVDNGQGFDPQAANAVGRLVSLSVRKSF